MLMLSCMLLPAAFVSAQTKTIYSLPALVDSARHHLPVLLQKQALVNSAAAGVQEARHAYLPKVNVVEEVAIGSANDLTGAFLPVQGVLHGISGGITGANTYQAGTSNIASLYAEYELVNFGLRGARVDNARAIAGVSQADLRKETYLVTWQLAKLWLDLLKAHYQLAVDAEDIRRNQSMYTVTQALTTTGINAGVDSSLAKAGLSRTKVTYNQTLGNLRKLEKQLFFLCGVQDVEVSADTSMGSRQWADMARALEGGGSDSAVNPISDYYVKQQLQYRSEQELIRKSYYSKIVAGAGGWARGSSIQYSNEYKGLGEGLGYQRLNYVAGVGITYDLFNGVRRKDRLAVAGYQAAAVDEGLQQQLLMLRNAAAQADESMRTAQDNLRELPVQVQAAREAYQQKLAQYQAGIINLIDLSNASFILYQAQSDYISTLNSWYLAGLDKAAATGKLDLFIQTVK